MSDKQPTNKEIMKEVKGVGERLLILEDWKRNEDAYRAALAQVKADEKESKGEARADDMAQQWKGILKQAGIVLGLIAAILYAYAATKGIATP